MWKLSVGWCSCCHEGTVNFVCSLGNIKVCLSHQCRKAARVIVLLVGGWRTAPGCKCLGVNHEQKAFPRPKLGQNLGKNLSSIKNSTIERTGAEQGTEPRIAMPCGTLIYFVRQTHKEKEGERPHWPLSIRFLFVIPRLFGWAWLSQATRVFT